MNTEIRFTRITTRQPARLSKHFAFVGDVLTKQGGGNMMDGIAERLTVNNIAELAALLPTLKPNQALLHGINGHDVARVVTQDRLDKARLDGGDLPIIARTRDHFHWPDGPGLLMLDYDAPAHGAPMDCQAIRAALARVSPALDAAPVVWRPSASSCIYSSAGAELRSIAGQRFYIPVIDADDVPRAGAVLFDRLWLAGYGRYELSKSGAFLARTLIDGSVFQPERLDFCGGASTGKGLVQRLPGPVLFNESAPYLDTRVALPNLTADEQSRLDTLRAEMKSALADEQARIRELWISERVETRLVELPDEDAREEARPHLERLYREAAHGGGLGPDFELTVVAKGTKARKRITVADVLKNRKAYHEGTTLDPLEPDYPDGQSRLVGWLNLNAQPPYLQSQAHGGTRYHLGAKETAPLDDGYWESVMQDAERSRACRNNIDPTLPTLPTVSITYSYTPGIQSYTSYTLPPLEDFDDQGRPVLIESKVAATLATVLKGGFAFCRESLRWHTFTETHWQPLTAPVLDEVVTQLLYAGAPAGFKARTLTAILSLLTKGLLPLPDTAADARAIPFTNGLLNLDTRTLHPITPDNALTWCLPYAYDPAADCPTIKAWLRQAVTPEDGDADDNPDDLVEFIRAWFNALLTGRADLQRFLHLLGPGGTGKGTFIRLAEALVGTRNATVTDLKNLETNRFETAAIYRKRLVAVTDSGKYGGSIDVFKAMTGQDPLRLEVKHRQQGATFIFDGLALIASNEPLMFTDYTGAIERRRITIEFSRRVSADERAQWDARGGEAAVLHQEIPGVVNWALALTREEVNDRMKAPPAQITRANTEAMQHSNPVADWLIQRVIPDANCALLMGGYQEITVSTRIGEGETESRKVIEQADACAYPNYRAWCLQYHRAPVSTRRFSPLVLDIARTLGASVYKGRNNSGMYIKGLRLRQEAEDDRDVWGQRVGSSAKSVGSVDSSFEKSQIKITGCVGSVGSDGKPPQTFSYSAGEREKNPSPLAQTILATLDGTPMTRADLERALTLAHGNAGPALINNTINQLLLSGAIAPIGNQLVKVNQEARP